MAKKHYANHLTSGVLGAVKQNRPEDPRYPMGCEVADGVVFVGDRMQPAPKINGPSGLRAFRWRAQQMMPPDQNFYLRNSGPLGTLTFEQSTETSDIMAVSTPDLLTGVLQAAMSAGNYAARFSGNFTITGTVTATGTLAAYINNVSVPVHVTAGELASAVATALAAAINAAKNIPGTASASGGVVNFNSNPVANQPTTGQNNVVALTLNNNGEVTPAGLAITTQNSDGGYGYYIAPSVFNSYTPEWGGTGGVVGSANNLANSRVIRYVRAFPISQNGQQQWGIVCTKTTSWSDNYRPSTWLWGDTTDTGSNYPTLILGRGNISVTKGNTTHQPWPSSGYSNLHGTITITPIVFTAPQGILAYAESVGVTVVGRMQMFNGAPSLRDYSYTLGNSPNDNNSNNLTVTTQSQTPNISGYEDCWVLYFGAPGSNTGYVDPGLITQVTGDVGFDYVVQGKGVGLSVTAPISTTTQSFAFLTARNIVVGQRRIGKAVYYNSAASNPNTTQFLGLGATQIGSGNTRSLPASSTTGQDPWFIMLPDGPPEWYEYSYNGLIVGTQGSEYLIENEQIAPGTYSINSLGQYVGVKIHRISSDGTPLACEDYKSLSCQLDGDVYYINQRGISRMVFSHEHQAAIPDTTDLVGMGFGLPNSLASSRSLGLVIAYCPNYGNQGVLICLDKVSGCITTITPQTQKDSAGNVYQLHGIDTLQVTSDQAFNVGEPLFVWVSTVGGVNTYMESQMLPGTMGQPALIRTSRFSAVPGVRSHIVKAFVELINTRGGRVRVAKPRTQGVDNPWIELPYTANQYGNPTDPTSPLYLGFTGVLEQTLLDRFDVKSEGKAVEIQFLPGENFQLVGVAVETEETE